MKKLKPKLKPDGTLVYDDLKGKLFNYLHILQIDGCIYVDLVFEDKTTFSVSLETQPHVRLSLYREHRNGDLKPISSSDAIPVPENQ